MICPNCNSQMIVLELNQIEIDYCTSCESIWLDKGEIELLLSESANRGVKFSVIKHEILSREKKLKCPMCSKKMNNVKIAEAVEVIIDRCKADEGYWFNKGELQKVLKANLDIKSPVINQIQEMFAYKLR